MMHIIDRRVRALEERQTREAAHEPDIAWYDFLVAASCPPDKRIHIRGGIAIPSGRWGVIMNEDYLPDRVCDFDDQADTQLALNFTNAGWFLPVLLCYAGDWVAYRTVGTSYEKPAFDNVVGTEVATAPEAEAQLDALLNGYTNWYYYRMPLHGVVFKNNGAVGVDYQIEPIDMVNRGRSYLYRDARSRGGIFP